jgi:hypothetical protein
MAYATFIKSSSGSADGAFLRAGAAFSGAFAEGSGDPPHAAASATRPSDRSVRVMEAHPRSTPRSKLEAFERRER